MVLPKPNPSLSDFAPLEYQGVQLLPWNLLPPEQAVSAVPAIVYAIFTEGLQVGWCDLRLAVNDDLLSYSGQIGYQISPLFRRQGLAFKACCALAMEAQARQLWPLIVTTNHDNHASQALLQALGASFLDQRPVPEGHELYRRGDRVKNRYQWASLP